MPEYRGTSNPFASLRAKTAIPWVIGVTALCMGAFHLLAFLATLVTPLAAVTEHAREVAFGLSLYAALALWIVWVCRGHGIGLRRLVGVLPEGYDWRSWAALAALLAVTMAFSGASFLLLASALANVAPGVLEFVIESVWPEENQSAGYRLATAVIAVILAPVFEEGFFRGILVNRWGLRWGLPIALVASSIAFGVVHFNPIGIGLVGLIAAILYIRTRTLIVPIAFHAANNLAVTVLECLDGDAGPLDMAAEVQELRDGLLAGVVGVAVTLPILIWWIGRSWPKRGTAIPYIAESP